MSKTRNERPINLNTATPEELAELPGIGAALAERISAGRPYTMTDDLVQVSGVGPRLLERIGPRVTVEETLPVEREAPSQVRPPRKRTTGGIGTGNALIMSLIVGLASALVAVGMTLGILLTINGTLNFGRHASVRGLSGQVAELELGLDELERQMASMDQRLAALDGLTGRMAGVEREVETLRQQANEAAATVEQMRSTVADLESQTATLSGRVNRFDAFLDGLRELLSAQETTTERPSAGGEGQ